MKIRNGFVSNSSSSSFIVKIKKDSLDDLLLKSNEILINKTDIRKLEKYGFKKNDSDLEFSYYSFVTQKNPNSDAKYLKYYVTCNQDDVLIFLLKNNIPFKAGCNYDTDYYEYKRSNDYILYAHNFGIEIEMYGDEHVDFRKNQPTVQKLNVKEFLKEMEL